jgi:ABC-type branched-subunit amino acid transport system substrate-binding protein
LLVPLTGPNAERGQALVNAAQLALATPGSPTLDVRDTAGTAQGAAAAATQALTAGAGLIIGPLTSGETAAVAAIARPAGVAVLAFTNDPAQAQPGVWTLGITPAQQVSRLVGASLAQGHNRFAAALPDSGFGHAMGTALAQAIGSAGAATPDIRYYDPSSASISSTMRELSAYASRRGPMEARRRAAMAEHSAEGRQNAAELSRAPVPPPPFDALLLAETGERLAWLTSFLTYYDVGPPDVQLMGPALWAAPSSRAAAAVNGAWYAAPDPAARASFEQAFTEKYAAAPPGVADFGYDAAAIGRVLAQEGTYSVGALCRPEGFAGVNGLIVLQPDGTVRRGLAIFQIDRGGPSKIEPAPESLAAPGI